MTVLGFVGSVAAAVVVALGNVLAGGILVLVSGAFDMLDGALARATGQSTRFGAFLDSVLDRLSEMALLLGILLLYLAEGSTSRIWVIFVALVGSVLVSYTRARAEGLGIKCEVGIFTRAERVIVLALGLLINQVFIALCIVAALAWVTAIQRFIHVGRQTRKMTEP